MKPQLGKPLHLLAFGFGSGLARRAPGTFGTLVGVLLYLPLSLLPLPLYAAVLILGGLAGIPICGRTSRDLGVHDHPGIVWDEIIGFWITMLLLPPTLLNIVLGFVLFRGFDILKPWPIRWLDRHVSGGFGIMIDDVLAGIFACTSVHLILYSFP